jgi:hypothetical protein
MKHIRLFTILGLLLCSYARVHAQANLSIQGTIQRASGANLDDGDYAMTFRLYESATGGTVVWSETQDAVEVLGGVYSTLLGKSSPLTAAFDKTYYLGVSVNNGAEMVPRIQLTASPYSLSLIGQTNIFPSTGPVGTGTVEPDPSTRLHVKKEGGTGRLLLEGSTSDTLELKKENNSAFITYDGDNISVSNLNLVITGDVSLPAGKTVEYNNLKDWRLVDVDDFSTGNDGWVCNKSNAGISAWATNTSSTIERFTPGTPASNGYIIRSGQNGNDALKKQYDLTGIPHTMIKVVFTYHFLDSWDPLESEFGWGGFGTRINPYDGPNQTSGIYQVGWNALANERMLSGAGYVSFWVPQSNNQIFAFDYNVREEMVAQCTDDKFWVIFSSSLNGTVSDESFGISDVQIWVK